MVVKGIEFVLFNVTDLINRITLAIIRQEGMATDYSNPGNLRNAPWLVRPVIVNGFWKPQSRAEGIAGVAHVVALRIAMRQSLRQLINAWAPVIDKNNTEVYIKNVKQWAQIPDENVPLLNYIVESVQ